MKRIFLCFTLALAAVVFAKADDGISLTFSRTGTTADDVEIYVDDLSGSSISGATATMTTSHSLMATANYVTEEILCPNVNGNTSPTIVLTFTIEGLSESVDYNTVALDLHALNSSGKYQSNTDSNSRQWNVSVETGSSEDDLEEFGSLEDIEVANGVGETNDVHQMWEVTSTTTYQTGSTVVISVTLTKGTTNSGCFIGLSEVQLYAGSSSDESGTEALSELVDSINDLGITAVSGTDPGYYSGTEADDFEAALELASEAVANEDCDADSCAVLAQSLREALAALLEADVVPLPSGYYYIVNTSYFYETLTDDENYGTVVSREKAMYADGDGYVLWATLDTLDLYYMWEVTELEDSGYSIRNLGSGEYIYGAASQSADVPTSSSQQVRQYFAGVGDGTWGIHSDLSLYSYHPDGHDSGEGVSGNIVTWQTTYSVDYRNTWYAREITNTSLIDSLEATQGESLLSEALQSAIDSAYAAYASAFSYEVSSDLSTGYVTDTTMFTSNAKETSEGAYSYLLDGEQGTASEMFHTEWSTGNVDDYHNLQVKLSESVDSFILAMWARYSNSDVPTVISLYGTNDSSLGVDSVSDNSEWTYIRRLSSNMPSEAGEKWQSDAIELGGSYRYLRFVVKETLSGSENTTTGYPYFSLSEFQLMPYSVNAAQSQYNYVEGLAEIADALIAMAEEYEPYATSETATAEQVATLRAELELFYDLYVSTAVYDSLQEVASSLTDVASVGTDPGCYSDDDIAALEDATSQAATTLGDAPTDESVAAAIEILEEAIAAFEASIITVDPDKWYYIISAAEGEDCEGDYMYMDNFLYDDDGDISLLEARVRHGGLEDDGTVSEETQIDARFMWRFKEVSDSTYYMQNMLYAAGACTIGNYYVYGADSAEYSLSYIGNAKFELRFDEDGTTYCLYAKEDNTNMQVTSKTYLGYDRSAWYLHEVEFDESGDGYITAPVMINNYARIMCLPFNVGTWDGYSVSEMNDLTAEIGTYAVKCVTYNESTGVTEVDLVEKDEFEAGEPFIMIAGDYNEYMGYEDWAADTLSIMFPIPTDYDDQAGYSNGLVGNYLREYVTVGGAGYISTTSNGPGTAFKCLTEGYKHRLHTNSGYVTPTDETLDGETAVVLEFSGEIQGTVASVLTVTRVEEDESLVSVYDLNGRLLRSGVERSSATEGLQKGIYIVGGKKIIVR